MLNIVGHNMKTLKGLYYFLSMLVVKITGDIIARVLSLIFFPIAFIFQDYLRSHLYSIDEKLVKERTFEDTLNYPTDKFMKEVNNLFFFLWMFLDDSTARDSYHKDGTPMYCASDSPERYPEWINTLDWYWLKATWWSFIRNNSVNYISWNKTSGWKIPLEVETLWGFFNEKIDKNDSNTYYVPGMYLIRVLHKDGSINTRFTYVGEVFGRKVGLWIGKSRGSGRFSFSVRA